LGPKSVRLFGVAATMRTRHRAVLVALLLGAAIAFPLGVLASHQFSDVPDSNPYHADIDALVDSGVTTGCGGGKYCPSAFVTREQMAAFMNRLGALQAGKTPVVNADRVDSRHASDLTRFAYSSEDATTLLPADGAEVVYGAVTITAPTSGFVLITASATVLNSGCTQSCDAFGRIRHVETDTYGQWTNDTIGTSFGAMSWTVVFPVTAGAHTFQTRLEESVQANGPQYGYWGQMTAQFSPFDGTGGTAAALSGPTGTSKSSPTK